jgi:hypothetical protein
MGRRRVLLTSSAIVLLCLTVILGMTWALFTDDAVVEHHLQAGDLDVTLKRTALSKTDLDEKGFLVNLPLDTTVVDFTDGNKKNVFFVYDENGNLVKEHGKVVPGSKYTATMEISNNSDVAFGYWIEIVCGDKAKGEDLAKQLRVTVDTDPGNVGGESDSQVGKLLQVPTQVTDDNDEEFVDVLGIGDKKTFTVCVEFLDSFDYEKYGSYFDGYNDKYHANDKAQGEKLSFDLVVHAVQVTERPQTYNP